MPKLPTSFKDPRGSFYVRGKTAVGSGFRRLPEIRANLWKPSAVEWNPRDILCNCWKLSNRQKSENRLQFFLGQIRANLTSRPRIRSARIFGLYPNPDPTYNLGRVWFQGRIRAIPQVLAHISKSAQAQELWPMFGNPRQSADFWPKFQKSAPIL